MRGLGGNRLAVSIPAVASHGLLSGCLESVFAQQQVRADVLIVQNSPKVSADSAHWQRGFSIYRPGRNIGVASSWNYACRWAWERGHDAVVLLNDDLVLNDRTTFAHFRASAGAQPRLLYFLAGCGFSAACITKTVWDEVGEFDEGFWPAYYEDNDMLRRAKLSGIAWRDIDLPSEHFRSAAIRKDPEINALNCIAFPLNQRRYIAKWGACPTAKSTASPGMAECPGRRCASWSSLSTID
jgi:GT2 family glycosyltransferase